MNDGRNNDKADKDHGWIDRHLPKILVAGAVLCILGLVGRAVTG